MVLRSVRFKNNLKMNIKYIVSGILQPFFKKIFKFKLDG